MISALLLFFACAPNFGQATIDGPVSASVGETAVVTVSGEFDNDVGVQSAILVYLNDPEQRLLQPVVEVTRSEGVVPDGGRPMAYDESWSEELLFLHEATQAQLTLELTLECFAAGALGDPAIEVVYARDGVFTSWLSGSFDFECVE